MRDSHSSFDDARPPRFVQGPRSGFTILETLVVIACILILLAVTIAAIQKVREAAMIVESKNNLKQIALATHLYADARSGRLPIIHAGYDREEGPVFFCLLPYMEHGSFYADVKSGRRQLGNDVVIRLFLSPADPTIPPRKGGLSSYAANAQVFFGIPNLAHVFADGASNTITFAEHYAFPRRQVQFDFLHGYESMYFESLRVTLRRATFADYHPSDGPYNPAIHDVYPITTGPPLTTTGSVPGLAFQVRPRIEECDTRIAQSPHSSGMLTAFGDASVRTLRGGMDPGDYWSLVTPKGGESVSLPD